MARRGTLLPACLWHRSRSYGAARRSGEPACGPGERRQLPAYQSSAAMTKWHISQAREAIQLAWQALVADKVKASLTMLGVMIGSMSLVLVVTIASTGKGYIIAQIEGIGANLAYATLDRNGAPVIPEDELTAEDLEHIRQEQPLVAAAAGTYDLPVDVAIGGRAVHARLVGVTDGFQQIRRLAVLNGRYFDQEDFASRAPVCLITEAIARRAGSVTH